MQLHFVSSAIVAALAVTHVSAETIASFENQLDGWITSAEQPAYSFAGFSTTQGVTDGTYAAIVTGNVSPTYGVLLEGPASTGLTDTLAGSDSLSIDVEIENVGDFGFFLQWTAVIDNADLGYVSLDGFSYSQSLGGGAATLTWPIDASQRAVLAASSEPSRIVFQVGGGNDSSDSVNTVLIDYVRVTTAIPEPSGLCMGCLGVLVLVRRRWC